MTLPIEAEPRSWRWHLERAAALLLLVLLPLHVVAAMVVGDPAAWSAVRLAARWQSPGWRVLDALTLVVALLHGLGAARRRLPDGRWGTMGRVAADVALGLGLAVVILAATTYHVV